MHLNLCELSFWNVSDKNIVLSHAILQLDVLARPFGTLNKDAPCWWLTTIIGP